MLYRRKLRSGCVRGCPDVTVRKILARMLPLWRDTVLNEIKTTTALHLLNSNPNLNLTFLTRDLFPLPNRHPYQLYLVDPPTEHPKYKVFRNGQICVPCSLFCGPLPFASATIFKNPIGIYHPTHYESTSIIVKKCNNLGLIILSRLVIQQAK